MKANFIFLSILLILGLVVSQTVNAKESAKELKQPQWSKSLFVLKHPNESYLYSDSALKQTGTLTLNQSLFIDEGMNRDLRNHFEKKITQNELSLRQGLSNSFDQNTQAEELKVATKDSLLRVSKLHLNKGIVNARKIAIRSLWAVKEPVAAAFFVASVMSGEVMRFNLGHGIDAQASTKPQNKSANLGFSIPSFGIESAVAFEGTQDQKFQGSLRKSIDSHLSATLLSQDLGTVKFEYRIGF